MDTESSLNDDNQINTNNKLTPEITKEDEYSYFYTQETNATDNTNESMKYFSICKLCLLFTTESIQSLIYSAELKQGVIIETLSFISKNFMLL